METAPMEEEKALPKADASSQEDDGEGKEAAARRRVIGPGDRAAVNRHKADAEDVVEEATAQKERLKRKRARRRERLQSREDAREAAVAAAMGFPSNMLTEEELEAGVVQTLGGTEQANYIVIRNHIIARWRKDVRSYLEESDLADRILPQHKGLLRTAYRFLLSHGYINFGVASAIKNRVKRPSRDSCTIIVGAGLAGLSAARQLLAAGHKVVVLEGRGRAGGRVHTKLMEGSGQSAAADCGGSVITGVAGNPLGVLAQQLKIPLHNIRDTCPLYKLDGQEVSLEADTKVEHIFNQLLDMANKFREHFPQVSESLSLGTALESLCAQNLDSKLGTVEERGLLDWHLANLEYANAGLLLELSLAFWDQDDPYEMKGDHCFLAGGNVRLVEALAEGLPIFYNTVVNQIKYSESGVEVACDDGRSFAGDMALCTIPLGVLKRDKVKFDPDLPPRKREAIQRLGFGLLNKVAMLFSHNFWGDELDTFGHLERESTSRGEYFLFYSYAAVAGGNLLIALVAGDAAHAFEDIPAESAVRNVLAVLKGIYEPKGITIPTPLSVVCTRWGKDPFAYGSYSNVAVGASGDDYDVMAESIGNGRVFFAGEATIRRYPATMHGAMLSGMREAAKMEQAVHQRRHGLTFLGSEGGPGSLAASSTALEAAFRKPDWEFGAFAVKLDPKKVEAKAPALLRVIVRVDSRSHSSKGFPVYTVITRQQAETLLETRGGDAARLQVLNDEFGVKLVGRRGLGVAGDAVLAALQGITSSRAE